MPPSSRPIPPLSVVAVRWTDPLAEVARRIRFEVFVHEQRVPVDEEIDPVDKTAHHALVLDARDSPWATGRTFQDPDSPTAWRIGRMAVLREARGAGAGRALMEYLVAHACAQPGCIELVLSAQIHAVAFYERFGFHVEGPEYMDAGILHRTMRFSPRGMMA